MFAVSASAFSVPSSSSRRPCLVTVAVTKYAGPPPSGTYVQKVAAWFTRVHGTARMAS